MVHGISERHISLHIKAPSRKVKPIRLIKPNFGPYDEFKLSRVRLSQLGLLSPTLGYSDIRLNWQHKQIMLSSLILTLFRLIKPDFPFPFIITKLASVRMIITSRLTY